MGLGVLHWSHIVSELKRLKRPNKLLIVFITDDFFRTDWTYSNEQILCVDGRDKCSQFYWKSYWYPISGNLSEIAAKRREQRMTPKTIGQFVKSNLIATYSIYRILTHPSHESSLLRRSLAVIKAFSHDYDLKLLWVNEKGDLDFSGTKSQAVAQGLNGLKISQCRIPRTGFLPRDAHPNASGYDVLKTCVEHVVRSW